MCACQEKQNIETSTARELTIFDTLYKNNEMNVKLNNNLNIYQF